jgi:hypothetical protein
MAKRRAKSNSSKSAEITVKYKLVEICTDQDLKDTKMSLTEMVKFLISQEGLFGIVEDGSEQIIEVKEI